MKKFMVLCMLLLPFSTIWGQETKKKLSFEGYTEVFYSYDFNKPKTVERQSFLYNYNRHNMIVPNIIMGKASYNGTSVRGALGVMAGTYVRDNLSAEPETFRYVYEANAGVRLTHEADLWLDAGILPSHIGWESTIGANCPTLTRSLTAENTPAYETGVRLSYASKDAKWYAALFLLNGWQNIKKVSGNQSMAFGHQLTFTPCNKFSINSSSYVGPRSNEQQNGLRLFHDLFAQINFNDYMSLIAGFDLGADRATASDKFEIWYSPVAILQSKLSKSWSCALRGEYYNDKNGLMIADKSKPFSLWSVSFNIDKKFSQNLSWRNELRMISADKAVLNAETSPKKNDWAWTTSLAISF